MKKAYLPSKLCVVCGRPFTWRKKWARDWDAVRYCSQACRRGKGGDERVTSSGLAVGRSVP
jgi:hypothetical protein